MQYYMQIDSMLRLNVWLINNNNIKYIYNSNNSNYKYIKYIISSLLSSVRSQVIMFRCPKQCRWRQFISDTLVTVHARLGLSGHVVNLCCAAEFHSDTTIWSVKHWEGKVAFWTVSRFLYPQLTAPRWWPAAFDCGRLPLAAGQVPDCGFIWSFFHRKQLSVVYRDADKDVKTKQWPKWSELNRALRAAPVTSVSQLTHTHPRPTEDTDERVTKTWDLLWDNRPITWSLVQLSQSR